VVGAGRTAAGDVTAADATTVGATTSMPPRRTSMRSLESTVMTENVVIGDEANSQA
jgi:hypothetical protein